MASEYLKWKYRDIKPEEKVELTEEEKRKNWWHYHKWYFVIGALLLLGLGSLIWNILGIGQVEPDYQIAYIGAAPLPEETVSALETGISSIGRDLNGDGRAVVTLVQYTTNGGDVGYSAAADVQITGDLIECESYFFLLEDPKTFQEKYHALSYIDGTLPPEGDNAIEEMCIRWGDCPVLAGLELGEYSYSALGGVASGDNQELLSGYYIARRGFWTEETTPNMEGCAELWEVLTSGASA